MVATDLQWINLKDFTPGIHSKLLGQGGVGGPYPLGAATEHETYRCLALPKGGLGPMPKRNKTILRGAIDVNANVVDPVGQYHVTGFYLDGPTVTTVNNPGAHPGMFFSYEYIYNNAGTNQRRYRLERYRGFDSAGGFVNLKSINSVETTPSFDYRVTTFGTSRSLRATPLQPGIPIITAAWFAGRGTDEKMWIEYPNDATPTVDAPYDIKTTEAGDVLAHQGRLLLFQRIIYNHGFQSNWASNENILYTRVNDVLAANVSPIPAVFVPENPSGYGTWGSMSANELFLVKYSGGGLTVMGDIADPSVTRLPNIVSTGNLPNIGTNSPVGFVYGALKNGAWAWAGGDSCENLSPQLDPDFWVVPVSRFKFTGGVRGVWATCGDWVLAPNNWLYDTTTKSWWRLDDPEIARMWNMQVETGGGTIWGAVTTFTDATTPIAHGYDKNVPALNWSWKSHPIPKTVDRLVNVRELVLMVQGTGTVTVTLIGVDGATTTETFTGIASNTYPITIRKNTALKASSLSVRIQSDGGATGAPVVYELRIGVDEKMREPVAEPVAG